jgi:hypothetical protein
MLPLHEGPYVKEAKKAERTNWGILKHSAVGEDHDRGFLGIGPRNFGYLSTSLSDVRCAHWSLRVVRSAYLPATGFEHLSKVQLVRTAQAQ